MTFLRCRCYCIGRECDDWIACAESLVQRSGYEPCLTISPSVKRQLHPFVRTRAIIFSHANQMNERARVHNVTMPNVNVCDEWRHVVGRVRQSICILPAHGVSVLWVNAPVLLLMLLPFVSSCAECKIAENIIQHSPLCAYTHTLCWMLHISTLMLTVRVYYGRICTYKTPWANHMHDLVRAKQASLVSFCMHFWSFLDRHMKTNCFWGESIWNKIHQRRPLTQKNKLCTHTIYSRKAKHHFAYASLEVKTSFQCSLGHSFLCNTE